MTTPTRRLGRGRHPIDRYAAAVVAGRLPAGTFHRLACERQHRDRAREATTAFPYRLDLARADRFLAFGQLLRHYKGEWAGSPIAWQPHQQFRLGSLFGWTDLRTGLRRFRHAYFELPRKQGKSLEDAVVGVYTTFFDGEPGAEGYCAATKKDQARIVFGDCAQLVVRSGLRDRITILRSSLTRKATASKLEPLGADEDSLDGLNPHFVSLDEIHKYKSRAMIDVLETATGARRQPVIYKITTAGDDLNSACGQEHRYACGVLDGTLVDETYLAFIAHADDADDWTLPATAQKANPNYGISVQAADLAHKVTKALGMASAAAAYQQKHLNRWIDSTTSWLSLDGWRKGQSDWDPRELAGARCLIGIDLAAKLDLTALVALFPPAVPGLRWRVLRWVWTPAETLRERAHRDRAPYLEWVAAGYLRTTPGTRVDHQVIRATLAELRRLYSIETIGFDPWHADQLMNQLETLDGVPASQLIEISQTYHGMSSGALALEAAVLAGEVDAQHDPVMTWAVGNAVVQRGDAENILPTKKRSRGRIDPVVALTMAFALAVRPAPPVPRYEIHLL
jgi:phage terminase large subunit-like protein